MLTTRREDGGFIELVETRSRGTDAALMLAKAEIGDRVVTGTARHPNR